MIRSAWNNSASAVERSLISRVWNQLDGMLSSTIDVAQDVICWLREDLPSLADMDLHELPTLARLHTSSATNLMKTLRLLVPGAFPQDSNTPNQLQVAHLDGPLLDAVGLLTELQLFHLQRAAELLAYRKKLMTGGAA